MENQNPFESPIQNQNENEVNQNQIQEPQQMTQENPQKFQAQQQAQVTVEYAGFWIRFCASFIDSVIASLIVTVIIIGFSVVLGAKAFESAYLFGLFLALAYFVCSTYFYQATIGKKVTGIIVVRENFEKVSLGRVILRETVSKIVSSMIFSIGYIMAGFTRRKRALHDMISGTVVIYKDPLKKNNGIFLFGIIIALLFFMMLVGYIISSQRTSFMGGKIENFSNESSVSLESAKNFNVESSESKSDLKKVEDDNVIPASSQVKSLEINTKVESENYDAGAESNVWTIASNLNKFFARNATYKGFPTEEEFILPIQNEVCLTNTRIDVSPDGKKYVVYRPLCEDVNKSLCIENGMERVVTTDTVRISKTFNCD